MKKKVRIILLSILLLAAGAGGVLYIRAPLTAPLTVLEPQEARVAFSEQGVYTYTRTLEVYPLLAGEIVELLAQEGGRVEAGETLLRLEAVDYEFQIAQLESSIAGYQAQVAGLSEQERQGRDALAVTREGLAGQLALLQAQRESWERGEDSRYLQSSLQSDVVRQNRRLVQKYQDELRDAEDEGDSALVFQLEQSLAQARQALATSRVVEEQLLNGELGQDYFDSQAQGLEKQIEALEVQINGTYTSGMAGYYNALSQAARSNINQLRYHQGKAAVTAPVAGVVTALPAQYTNVVSQQGPVAVIGWDEGVEVYVSTRELGGVAVGDMVELTQERRSGDLVFAGTVVEIGQEAELAYSALGVEERKLKVLILPDGGEWLVGSPVTVTFLPFRQENALVIPKTAVFDGEQGKLAWVVREGAAYAVPVEVSLETRSGYLVAGGLEAGDVVVTDAGLEGLAQGKALRAAG